MQNEDELSVSPISIQEQESSDLSVYAMQVERKEKILNSSKCGRIFQRVNLRN
jgi:hypothetical protein